MRWELGDWNVARRRLQFAPFRSLNVWFHSPRQDYTRKVKAYTCMCSRREWIMYSDSRDRWIYDHQLKRIAVTLNQEVLVKSCYKSQRWTHCRSLPVLPQSSAVIRVQESLRFQLSAKLLKIASCHLPVHQVECLQTQTDWSAPTPLLPLSLRTPTLTPSLADGFN